MLLLKVSLLYNYSIIIKLRHHSNEILDVNCAFKSLLSQFLLIQRYKWHSLAPIWHQVAAHHVMVHFSQYFCFFNSNLHSTSKVLSADKTSEVHDSSFFTKITLITKDTVVFRLPVCGSPLCILGRTTEPCWRDEVILQWDITPTAPQERARTHRECITYSITY